VRPPRLTNGPKTGTFRAGRDVKIGLTSKISRADLATALLEAAANRTFIRAAPTVAS
jgi:putative NADH-flavin reductase